MSVSTHNNHVDDTNPVMPDWSSYAGKPVDVTRRRSIRIHGMHGPACATDVQTDSLTLNWFMHESEFFTAIVPLDGVDQVYGQAFNFSAIRTRETISGQQVLRNRWGLPKRRVPVMNHVQSRFRFHADKPIQLFRMTDTGLTNPVHTISDFVYSLEVTGPPRVKFNLQDGLKGNLLSAHRMLSTQEMVFERLVVESQVVTESPPLDLTDAEKRALLTASLLRSHSAGLNEPYRLLRFRRTNNCTSSPLQILDQVVQYTFLQRLGSLLYRLPLNPRWYLRLRGLDSDPSVKNLVSDEFADYIDAESTQERKRIHVERLAAAKRAASCDV